METLKTRTGGFPIGFRRGWSEWQKDLGSLSDWAKENGLSVIDVGTNVDDVKAASAAGLKVGSADALAWGDLMSADAGKRRDAVAKNAEYVAACAAAGATNFFICLLPENAGLSRHENFGYAVESLAALAPSLEKSGACLVIEGYPGAGALACTPESVRALLKEVPSSGIKLNYDPSHLWRMNIDALRFLREFAPHVRHVHGKDTEILAENVYEFGTEQPATFAKAPAFGGNAWRYTIPGAGLTAWPEVFSILKENNYAGAVCIELEDANYNDVDDQAGIMTGARFLAEQ